MNAANYRRLEVQLAAAEEVFSQQAEFGSRAREIRDQLRDLTGKVVAARIRAENLEERPKPDQ